MASKSVTVVIDDLTGRELAEGASETVSFSLDGVRYELDVSNAGAQKLRSTMAPYIKAGPQAHAAAFRSPNEGRIRRRRDPRLGRLERRSPSARVAASRRASSPSTRPPETEPPPAVDSARGFQPHRLGTRGRFPLD